MFAHSGRHKQEESLFEEMLQVTNTIVSVKTNTDIPTSGDESCGYCESLTLGSINLSKVQEFISFSNVANFLILFLES